MPTVIDEDPLAKSERAFAAADEADALGGE